MIHIAILTSGDLLVQKDADEIVIARNAIGQALPIAIGVLVDAGRLAGQARREGYEAGLLDGRERARIEQETATRIAARAETEALTELAYALTSAA